jgi:hypothetical protein
MSRGNWVRRGSSRLYLSRGFAEGEAWAARGLWVDRRYFSMLVNSHRFSGSALASTYYLDTTAGGGGDGSIGSPWNTLEASRAGLISIFSSGFVSAAIAPTLICTGATDDATAVTNTWPTSSTTYYLTIKVPDADRKGEWDASKYTLARSAAGSYAITIGTNSIRLVGLQIYQTSATGSGILNIDGTGGGNFIVDGCKLFNSGGGGSVGIRASGIGGNIVLRNFLVVNPVHGLLLGNPTGLLTGTNVFVYNGTIWGSGAGGEACQITFAAGGSGRVARVKNMMMYAQTNGISTTNEDTEDLATNSKGGVDTSHFVAPGNPPTADWRIKSTSSNKDAGTDLSGVGAAQWQFSEDVSLYTRPYNGTWDRGYHEYRP